MIATGIGRQAPEDAPPPDRDECKDPARCAYWQRRHNGPWTCENCHPTDLAEVIELTEFRGRR